MLLSQVSLSTNNDSTQFLKKLHKKTSSSVLGKIRKAEGNSGWDETTLSLLDSRNMQINNSNRHDWNNIQRVKPEEIVEEKEENKRIMGDSFNFQKHLQLQDQIAEREKRKYWEKVKKQEKEMAELKRIDMA